ncbi:hypothetical protein LTR82_000626 [Friedmanniomyces endolithicus]|uniref:Uncharacterized protein n=1 Tax=Friedmanniomyces endolithicus TaxID=329885 RepID=A0AAN6G4Z3_9PEZI|nr:hypothetical protein LTR82_000626 [Friedmanniomyces endolithicus]
MPPIRLLSHLRSLAPRRLYTTGSPSPSPSRIARLEARLPRFLHRFTVPLRNAPVSHITAFLVLHELTAVVPLFGLAALFHYSDWLPPFISEGRWVTEGTEKFGRYFRRKGWISEADGDEFSGRSGQWWGRSGGGVRIVVEFATAYAITKALLPLRLVLSAWATPWFARWTILPITGVMKKVWQKTGGGARNNGASLAVGKTAVGAGVLSREAKMKARDARIDAGTHKGRKAIEPADKINVRRTTFAESFGLLCTKPRSHSLGQP